MPGNGRDRGAGQFRRAEQQIAVAALKRAFLAHDDFRRRQPLARDGRGKIAQPVQQRSRMAATADTFAVRIEQHELHFRQAVPRQQVRRLSGAAARSGSWREAGRHSGRNRCSRIAGTTSRSRANRRGNVRCAALPPARGAPCSSASAVSNSGLISSCLSMPNSRASHSAASSVAPLSVSAIRKRTGVAASICFNICATVIISRVADACSASSAPKLNFWSTTTSSAAFSDASKVRRRARSAGGSSSPSRRRTALCT